MSNDVYNNKQKSSLEEAYAKLREAQNIRNASVKNQQYDNVNGVALNTTPVSVNQQVQQQVQPQAQQQQANDASFFERLGGTISQAANNILRSFVKLGEGVVDAHIAIGGIFDKEWAEETIKYDATDAIMTWAEENASANALYKQKTGKSLYDQSWLNDANEKVQDIVIGIEQGIGNSLGFAALNSIPWAGIGLSIMGAGGTSMEEAINDPDYNGDYYKAWGYGAISGGIEFGLEKALGWSPSGGKTAVKSLKNAFKDIGKNFLEEGVEEVASEVINPLFKGMYNNKSLQENYEDVTLENLATTFVIGGATGAIMTGAGDVARTLYLSPEGSKIANEMQIEQEKLTDAYNEFKKNPNEAAATENFAKVRDEVGAKMQELGERIGKLADKYKNRLGSVYKINGQKVRVPLSQELVNAEAKEVLSIDPRVRAVRETIDLINNAKIKGLENMNLEFVTDSKKNGWIDKNTNTIYLNTNSQKAMKFILGHEITHPMEDMKEGSEYKGVYDEIIASLQESGKYDSIYKATKKRYSDYIKNKTQQEAEEYINQEIVADYIGENLTNFDEIQKLFTKQSTWEKFKNLIKNVRNKNTSSKAKEYYQRFLKAAANTRIKEKKQNNLKLANIKYSMADYKGGNQIFDVNDTGMPYYNALLPSSDDREYYIKQKNLKGTIVKMTPQQYYERCLNEVFKLRGNRGTVEDLKETRRIRRWYSRENNVDFWGYMKSVLTEKKKLFDIPVLDLADISQEGLHRMMLAGDMFGWDTPQKVLVVKWADKQKHIRDVEKSRKRKLKYDLERTLNQFKNVEFDSTGEFMDEVEWQLKRNTYDDNVKLNFEWKSAKNKKYLIQYESVKVIYKDVSQRIVPKINWKKYSEEVEERIEKEVNDDYINFDFDDDFLVFEDDNIKYSIAEEYSDQEDSDGEPLTVQQEAFFKDSKIREDENLLVLYHGTNSAGFMTFNSDTGVYFFTPDYEVADTYADEISNAELVNTSNKENIKIPNFEKMDINNDSKVYEILDWFYSIKEFTAKKHDWEILTSEDGDVWEEAIKKYIDKRIKILKKHNVPKIMIQAESVDNYEQAIVVRSNTVIGDEIFHDSEEFVEGFIDYIKEYDEKFSEATSVYTSQNEAIYKVYLNVTNPLIINCRGNNFMNVPFRGQRMRTDDIAVMVKEEGKYDGIIFKNIMDNGASDINNSLGTSDVYVAFEPNQIKATDNLNPTKDDDIRYSIAEEDDFDVSIFYDDGSEFTEEELREFDSPKYQYQKYLKQKELNKLLYDNLSDAQKGKLSIEKRLTHGYKKLTISLNKFLSPKFKEMFKDSKIRYNEKEIGVHTFDSELQGLLVPMFHGTPDSNMYYFDANKIGKHGTDFGAGFYLTSDFTFASHYGRSYSGVDGKVIMAFVNIKKPLLYNRKTISKKEINNFVDKLSLKIDISKADKEMFDYALKQSRSDANMIFVLYDATKHLLSYDSYFDIVTKELGYDGALYQNGHNATVIAFKSNQIKDVVNINPTDNPDIRYSVGDNINRQPKSKLAAELKEGKVYNVNEGEAVVDELQFRIGKEESVSFKGSKENVLHNINDFLNLQEYGTDEYNQKLDKLADQIVENMKVNNESLKSVLGDIYKDAKIDLMDTIKENINEIAVEKGKTSYTSKVNKMLKNFAKEIVRLKKLNANATPRTYRLFREIWKARDFIKQGKVFKEGTLKELAQNVYDKISKIRFTGTKNIEHEARNVLVNLREELFENEKVKAGDYLENETIVYLNTALKFMERRGAEFKDDKKKPSLDSIKDVGTIYPDEQQFDLLRGKTETDIAYDIIKIAKKLLKEANESTIVLNGQTIDYKKAATEEKNEQVKIGRKDQKSKKSFSTKVNQAMTSLLTPKAWFDMLAKARVNSLFNQVYNELEAGEDEKLQIKMDLLKDLDTCIQSKDGKKLVSKLKDKKYKINLAGKDVNYGYMIGLYLSIETDNAPSHIFGEGVDFVDENGTIQYINGQDFIAMLSDDLKNEFKNINNLKKPEEKAELRQRGIEELKTVFKEMIGTESDELIRLVKKIYSSTGEIYKSASEEVLGYSYPPKNVFYPIKADPYSFQRQTGTLDDLTNHISDTMNPSWTKRTVKNASNRIQIGDVLDTVYIFVDQLSSFKAISTRVKKIDKLLNSKVDFEGSKITFRQFANSNIDANFTKRYNDLILAMQGIKYTPTTDIDRLLNKARGVNSVVALGANVKTYFSQFTAFLKANLYVSAKNMLRVFGSSEGKNFTKFDDIVQEIPFLYDRYYGNQGRNIAEMQTVGVVGGTTLIKKLAMKLIEWADYKTLALVWRAVQFECINENGVVDKEKAKELMVRVVRDTQATYTALGNGSITRVNNEIVKGGLMYSSESRKTLNMFVHSVYRVINTKRGTAENKKAWKDLATSSTSMIASSCLIAALSFFLKALKGDYDEKDKEEIVKSLLLEELTPQFIGMIPFVKDIYNKIVLGYDLQISGFSQITDLLDLPKFCGMLMDSNTSGDDKKYAAYQIAQRIAHAFGIPMRNIYNDIMYLAGIGDAILNTDMVLKMRNLYYNTTNSKLTTLMKSYAKKEDTEKVSATIQIKFKKYGAGEISEKAADEIARLYVNGSIDSMPSQLQDTFNVNGVEVELTKAQYSHAKEVYSLANDLLIELMNSSIYNSLSDEEKAKAIKKLYSTYYELAKSDVVENYEVSKLTKLSDYINTTKYIAALSKINNIGEDKKSTRKVAVMKYINSLRMNRNEKYLLLYLSGYSVDDSQEKMLLSFLRSKGLSYKDAKELLGV